MRVLVVDDHILFRQGLVSLLESEPDFEIVGQAGTLTEAIELAQALKPDTILMDFELPDGTGAEATRPILAGNPDCRIIFLTVHTSDEKLFEAIRSGAVGYLLKSMPISKLLDAVRSTESGEAALSRSMTRKILAEFARPAALTADTEGNIFQLTPRELEILHEIMEGATNQEIAHKFYVSENTVKHHVHNILDKLQVQNRHQAAEFARRHGLN